MLTWYQPTVKYWAEVEGKRKIVSELYALHCVSFGDVEATCTEILKSRIKSPDVDTVAKLRLSDVYIKPSVSGVDSTFFIVTVELEDGGDKKLYDKHLLNANSAKNAIERVTARMKGTMMTWKIKKVEETKILGIYDKLQAPLVEDFEARQEHLSDLGKVETGYNQYGLFDQDEDQPQPREPKQPKPQSDPNAITAMVIHNGVVSVDAEDLNNGQHGDSEHLEHVRELPAGNTRLLDEPADVAA